MKLGRVLIVILLMGGLLLGGCGAQGEGFAIYLLQGNVPPAQLPALSHLELAEEPLITQGDVVSYEAATHRITLEPAAYARVTALKVPTSGLSFAVCVNRSPVYAGAFWADYSSQSYDGVVIMQPRANAGDNTIAISLGYPSGSFFRGDDPRGDARIMNGLRAAGKLK